MKELALINQILKHNAKLPDYVTIPPGDDMAMLALNDQSLLVATDQIAQDVHFLLDEDSPASHLKRIGHKALARNLSDIAAMAARPLASLLTILLPPWLSDKSIETLLEGYRETADRYQCPLIGGDTGHWPRKESETSGLPSRLVLNVTVLAAPFPDTPILSRQGTQAGDGLYVSGNLGGSLWIPPTPEKSKIGPHHLTFEPRLELARQLAATDSLHAMLDLSDGLASDARRLLQFEPEASSISLVIETEKLPISDSAVKMALNSEKSPVDHALTDGEDYELLFTAPVEKASLFEQIGRHLKTPITLIGHARQADESHPQDLYRQDEAGKMTPMLTRGYEHD